VNHFDLRAAVVSGQN